MTDTYTILQPAGKVNPHGTPSDEIGKLVASGISVEAATCATEKLLHFANTGAGTDDCDVAAMFIDGGDGSTMMFIAYRATTEKGKKRLADMGKPRCGAFPDIWIDAPLFRKENPIYELIPRDFIALSSNKPTSMILFNSIFWNNEEELISIAKNARNRNSGAAAKSDEASSNTSTIGTRN